VLFDRWWNPATEDQAISRAHRMGQKFSVNVYRFQMLDTIEERISDILCEKEALFEEYIENAQNAKIPTFNSIDLIKILDLTSEEQNVD